jgi:hypothetical protein
VPANSLHTVLQHLHAGRWNAAHDLVQHDGSMLAAWLHGILHLQEGDLEDAENWYDTFAAGARWPKRLRRLKPHGLRLKPQTPTKEPDPCPPSP